MIPYIVEKNLTFAANEVKAIDAPTRQQMTKLVITGLTNGDKINVYNRMIAQSVSVSWIVNNGAGFCKIIPAADLLAKPGDTITVGSNSVVGYNTTHLVTARDDATGYLTTNVAYTADGSGGSVSFDFSSIATLYRVIPEQTAALTVVNWSGDVPFLNMDPKVRYNSTHRRKIYVQCDQIRSVRLAMTLISPEDF